MIKVVHEAPPVHLAGEVWEVPTGPGFEAGSEEVRHLLSLGVQPDLGAVRDGAGGHVPGPPLPPLLPPTDCSEAQATLRSEPVLQTLHLQPAPPAVGVCEAGHHPGVTTRPVLLSGGVRAEDRTEAAGLTELTSLADLRWRAGPVTGAAPAWGHHGRGRRTGGRRLTDQLTPGHHSQPRAVQVPVPPAPPPPPRHQLLLCGVGGKEITWRENIISRLIDTTYCDFAWLTEHNNVVLFVRNVDQQVLKTFDHNKRSSVNVHQAKRGEVELFKKLEIQRAH